MYRGEKFKDTYEGTEAEAAAAHEDFKYEVKHGMRINKNIKLQDFVKIYTEVHLADLELTTQKDYEVQFKKRIVARLGKYKLNEINPIVLKRFYKNLKAAGDGDRTVQKNHAILSSMLTQAVYLGYLDSNPCRKVKAPKYKREHDDNFFTFEELLVFLDELEKEPLKWQITCLLPIFTGVRRSEAVGLEWNNVDMKKGLIKIEKARLRVQEIGIIEKGPKKKASYRYIPVPQFLIRKLAIWKKEQTKNKLLLGTKFIDNNYVITHEDGVLVSPDAPSRVFRRIVDKNDLGYITFHGLRHTYATLLIHSNEVPGFAISGNMGHSDPTTHQRIYAHEISESNRLAATYFDKLMDAVK
jgi:integrase